MPANWPPPPDLASIQELLRAADPMKHLAEGAPADEYEPEEQEFFGCIQHLAPAELTTPRLTALLEPIFARSFSLDEAGVAEVRPALLSLSKEVERFFGSDAQPRTRGEIVADQQASHSISKQQPR